MNRLLLLLATCLSTLFIYSADLNVTSRQLSSANGLGSNYVRSIVQDARGYIWMGATNGLIRYDGYSAMLIMPGESADRKLMLDFRVQSVDMWCNRFVWLRLRGRKYSCYDTVTNSFVDFTGDGTYAESYKDFSILPNGDLCLTDPEKDCKILHFDGKRFSYKTAKTCPSAPEIPKAPGVPEGKWRLDNRGNSICITPQDDVWYVGKDKQVTHLSGLYSSELRRQNGDSRLGVVTDGDGIIWVSTYGNGLFAYNPQTRQTAHFLKHSNNNAPIQNNYLLNIYEDRAGNIWVCQENMGVACISKQKAISRTVYFTSEDVMDHANSIHLLTNIAGTVYVGNRLNGLKLADDELNFTQSVEKYNDDIVSVCADKNGKLWLGTRNSGVYAGDLHLQHQPDNPHSLSKGKISDIVVDHRGRIWISNFQSGVDMGEPDGKGGYRFTHFFTGKNTIVQPRKMLIDHAGYIWLCSNEGLYAFHPDRLVKNAEDYRHLTLHGEVTNADEIHSICETPNHQILAGTLGFGVAVFDNSQPDRASLTTIITSSDGLPDNNIQQLIVDDEGQVWIGTDNGLGCYNEQTQTLTSVAPASTPLGNMFIENACCKLARGQMAFGTRHGIIVITPKDIPVRKSQFPLRITNIDINGVAGQDFADANVMTSIERHEDVVLNYNQNSLTFHFSDFEYAEGENTRYSYRLKGYDNTWHQIVTSNQVVYQNLPPGTYTMEVRAKNNNGQWNDEVVSQTVVIRSPFWATWWAYLFYVVVLCGLAYFVYTYFKRINDLRNRIKVENQLTEYKIRFFTNISHEFRTPLTIIRGAMERIQTTDKMPGELKQPVSSMQKSVSRLLRMVNQLLEFSRMHEDKLQLHVEPTDVVAFVRDITLSFREIAESKHITTQYLPFARNYEMLVDQNFLDKIAYNLISNAFKYTPPKGMVDVRLQHDEGWVRLVVKDTGIGMSKEKQAQLFTRFDQSAFAKDSIGIGLHLTNELVRVHHGTISYAENPDGGSIFTVSLPTDELVYSPDERLTEAQRIALNENQVQRDLLVEEYREMPPVPLNKRRVLIVDDDSDVRQYLVSELQRYFIVSTACDGADAIEKILQEQPELIVTDVMMPVMSGYELVRRLRTDQALSDFSDISVVMLTALTGDDNRLKGIETGAEAYLEKPFSPRILIAMCCKMLEQRDKLRDRLAQTSRADHQPDEVIISDVKDQRFREQLDAWMQNHISDTDLNIETFAASMGYGRTTFFKKLKKVTGMTPNDYIRNARMNMAAELLKDEHLTAAEVAFKVGFNDQFYFSKTFKQWFGMSPTKYRQTH